MRVRRVEPKHLSVDPAQAFLLSLLAGTSEHLHADADAEHGHALLNDELVERRPHARAIQEAHRVVERSDAGKNELRRARKICWAARDRDRDTEALVTVGEGEDVAEAIVDDRDHLMMAFWTPMRRRAWVPSSIIGMRDL